MKNLSAQQNIRRNFSRGAKNYNDYAIVQALSAKELVTLTLPFLQENSQILDLGSGTSFLAKALANKHRVFEVDIAFDMLKSWAERPKNIFAIQADFHQLPFLESSFDAIISSFSLQWLNDFSTTFSQFFSLLKPNGIFAFCLPVEKSLEELSTAEIFSFNKLPDEELIIKIAKHCGFNQEFSKREIIEQNFPDGISALRSIKKIGANHSSTPQKNLGKSSLEQFNNFCLKNSAFDHKTVKVSWHVSFFILRKKP